MAELPKFSAPPIAEVVLGVQFEAVENWSAAHTGRFWSQSLDANWVHAKEAPPLETKLEEFTGRPRFARQSLRISEGQEPVRVQITTSDGERMLQIQDSRVHYNWRRRSERYPGYDVIRAEFLEAFGKFQDFVGSSGIGSLAPNLWELTYVNRISRGDLWATPGDWGRVLPSLALPSLGDIGQEVETIATNHVFIIGDNRGRLYLSVRHASDEDAKDEMIRFELTARGPVEEQADLPQGLDLGHEAIVRTFVEFTSEEAHRAWDRTQ